jgi:hypothetical protein
MLLIDSKGLMRVAAAFFRTLVIAVFLTLPTLRAAETILVGQDAQWKYYSSQTPPPENWKAPTFIPETWSSGPAQLGYGDGDEATVIAGGDLTPRPAAAYFRRSFSVGDPSMLSKLVFRLLRDDGAVVYLNGVEVIRSNMPDGAITPETLASTTVGADAESLSIAYDVPASALVAGENVVAVEVHQSNVASSDLSFALQILGVSGGDIQPPTKPGVSIAASQPQTAEPGPTLRMAPGKFTISRSGSSSNDAALPVYLHYDGTATPGIDYEELPTRIVIPAGASSIELLVMAKADNLLEDSETVVAKISEPPTSPDSIPYTINPEHSSATVTIAELSPAGIRITKPENGVVFNAGITINFQAIAVDREGTIEHVSFYAGDKLIGTSDLIFITQPAAGTPLTHSIEWKDAPVGDHIITARGVSTGLTATGKSYVSDPITIHVRSVPEIPVVSIEATMPFTSEPLSDALVAPGVFTLRRTGSLDNALNVWVAFGGTAKNGIDYESVANQVLFAAGQSEAFIQIVAKSDELIEGDETVVAELTQPPTAGAVLSYNINPDKRRAVITIKDEDKPAQARIEITSPTQGAMLRVGSTVTVKATAVDPGGYIPRVEFFSDGASIGVSEIAFIVAPDPGAPIYHSVEWKNVPIGEHVLTAKGVRANGEVVVSPGVTVNVVVVDPPPPPIVSIRKVEDQTERPIPNADFAPDFFEIHRDGPTNEALKVYFRTPQDGDHIATPEVDYKRLVSPVTIAAGETNVFMRVEAIDDELVEGTEIVRVALTAVPSTVDPAGASDYVIDPEHASADAAILDNDQPVQQVVLAVSVLDGIASEVSTTDALDTAVMLIKRIAGPENVEVTARYELSGTAQNGVDYEKLAGTLQLPAGAASAAVKIVAIPDDIEEGEETVILTLVPANCPIAVGTVPPPECYLVGEAKSGRAVIVDHRDAAPGVKILHPVNGAVFSLGQTIEIEAQAWDREGIISKLEILADGKQLGQADDDHLVVRWADASLGDHLIVAHAVDGSGQEGKAEIHIRVREESADAFVFRKLPPAYTPGTTFEVELRAEPPAGGRAYAVEDQPPAGWVVSSISNDGVFDAATGKVKFGPFTDTTARTLSYKVTPPVTASGRKEFVGIGSIDGVNYRIGGDRIVEQSPTEHPADTDRNFAINVAELTAYAAAWKRGEDVPLSYLTRAGFIWKHGEAYKFDGSHEPPFCWVPLQAIDDGGVVHVASVVASDRVGNVELKPGVDGNFELRIVPPAGTSAYAVEEKVPLGWAVSNISDDGTFDAATGIIRWGVFFDATSRTLSYTLTPPPGVTAVARLGGRVSFDGAIYEISGCEKTTSTDSTSQPTIGKCESDGSKVHLELSGGAGQVGVLQSSTDLVHWQDVTTLFLPDGTVQFDDNASATIVKYYRLQVR